MTVELYILSINVVELKEALPELSIIEWVTIGLVVAEFIVSLTPTEKDNSALAFIRSIIDRLLPNRKKGGGKFTAYHDTDQGPTVPKIKRRKR